MSLGAKRALITLNPSRFSIVNSGISLKVVISLYQYEFGDGNLSLLCQYIFKVNNLAMLMKIYEQFVMVLTSGINLALL